MRGTRAQRALLVGALVFSALDLTACASTAGPGLPCEFPSGSHLEEQKDGGFLVVFADESVARLAFANGVCVFDTAALPVPRQELSDEELLFLYDYYRSSLGPCLDRLGYTFMAPPSRESFVASGGNWSPYDAVFTPMMSAQEISSVGRACPALPAQNSSRS